MKKILSNLAIIFLSLLLIFQGLFLWISPGILKKREKIEEFNTQDIIKKIFTPRYILANFSPKNHGLIFKISNYWKEDLDKIGKILSQTGLDEIEEISMEEYMTLQEKPSIVYRFSQVMDGRIFINAMGYERKNREIIKGNFSEIYFSQDGDVILHSADKNYKLKYEEEDFVKDRLTELAKSDYLNVLNFKELYGINKNIYLPKDKIIYLRDISYVNEVSKLNNLQKANMAMKFLSKDIDYIKEIKDQEGNTYVYGPSFLKILDRGLIAYKNTDQVKKEDSQKYENLILACNFIGSKTGKTDGFYFSSYNNQDKDDFNLSFEFREDGIPLIFMEDKKDYINLKISSKQITEYQEIYRRSEEGEGVIKMPIRTKKLEDIILENPQIFSEGIEKVLENIGGVSLVYLDLNEKNLKAGLKISYKNKSYYYSYEAEKFIEVKNGLAKS